MPTLRILATLAATVLALTPVAPAAAAPHADGPPAHGSLISTTEITGQPDVDIAHGGSAHRLRYETVGVDGASIQALATVHLPEHPPQGPLRVLAYTHGTSGVGRDCTVGTSMGAGGRYDDWLGPWLEQGYAVVVPEYGGIGTTGKHPYLAGEATAQTVLDAVRASRELPAADLGDELVVYGGSQGGHTALWVNSIAATYTPDLTLVGSVGASVPAAVDRSLALVTPLTPHVPGTGDLVGYLGFVLAGLANSGTDLDRFDELSTAGHSWVARAQHECYQELAGEKVAAGTLVTRPLLGSALSRAVREHTRLPEGRLPAPSLVQKGAFDIVAPVGPVNSWVRGQRSLGADVDTRTYATGHGLTATSATDALAWSERLAWTDS